MDLLPGVAACTVTTSRLRTHYYEYGPESGTPVVMIHGNLSTGRFFEHLWPGAPDGYRFIAPDMRSFGRSEPKPINATRGLRDWADDTRLCWRNSTSGNLPTWWDGRPAAPPSPPTR